MLKARISFKKIRVLRYFS